MAQISEEGCNCSVGGHFQEVVRRHSAPTDDVQIHPAANEAEQKSIEPSEELASEVRPITAEEISDNELLADRRNAGDIIGVGEILAKKLKYIDETALDTLLSSIIATWASPARIAPEFESTNELSVRSHEFVLEHLSLAFVHAYARLRSVHRSLPLASNDITYRLADSIADKFAIGEVLKENWCDIGDHRGH